MTCTAAAVEAGGLRWGDTRVKGVSEHFSLFLSQLYELDGDPRRKEFLDDLFSFMQKRGGSPAELCPCVLCPPCSTTPTLRPPHPRQGRGLISLPLISAPRSRLRLSCWLIFNPSAQRGQTCWAGSSSCGPPSVHPLPPDLQPLPANETPLAVPPLCPIPGLLQGAKPLAVPSLCPGRGRGWEELEAKLEGLVPAWKTALEVLTQGWLRPFVRRHWEGTCACTGGLGLLAGSPRVPLACPLSWLCPLGSPWLCPMLSPQLHPLGSPRAPSPQGWDPDEGAAARSPLPMLEG